MFLETIEQKRARIVKQQERRALAEYYRKRIERFNDGNEKQADRSNGLLHPLSAGVDCIGF